MSGGRVTLRFSAEQLRRLEERAARAGVSAGVFAKRAVMGAVASRADPAGLEGEDARRAGVRQSGKDPAARVSHVQEAPSAGSRPAPAEPPPSAAGAQVADFEPRRALVDVMVEQGWSVSLATRAIRMGQVMVGGERALSPTQQVRAAQVRVVA